jgi:class 3 adenylate cyclase
MDAPNAGMAVPEVSPMRCPCCDTNILNGAKFCIEYGAPLTPCCPQCGADTLPRAKFCSRCGTLLTAQTPAPPAAPSPSPLRYTPRYLAEKILTSKTTLEGEHKQVTVLLADKGSMELLADRDPEDARQLLDLVLEGMMAAVHHYAGTVNHVMGDGIMALFDTPVAHEDHAVRACYAVFAMQEGLRHYSAEVRHSHGVEVQIRVGLNSGEVVVRAIDSILQHLTYGLYGGGTNHAPRGAHGTDSDAGLDPHHACGVTVGGRSHPGERSWVCTDQRVGRTGGGLKETGQKKLGGVPAEVYDSPPGAEVRVE